MSEIKDNFREKLSGLKLEERHYSIDPNQFTAKMGEIVNEFLTELSLLKKQQPSQLNELKEEIDKLFSGKVGPPPANQDLLDEFYKQAKSRFQQNRPPGFKDQDKEKDQSKKSAYFYHDLYFQKQYGDVLLWFQIIDKAKSESIKNIIFVTDDNKEDWWRKVGGKQIGPRIELIDEIRTKAGVKFFHMYNSVRFLTYAKKQFGIEIREASIEQVREITNRSRNLDLQRKRGRLIVEAVVDWVTLRHPNDKIIHEEHVFPDVVRVDAETNKRIGYEIRIIRRRFDLIRFSRDLIYRGYYEVKEKDLDHFFIMAVADPIDDEESPNLVIETSRIETPKEVSIITGYVEFIDSKDPSRSTPIFRTNPEQLNLF